MIPFRQIYNLCARNRRSGFRDVRNEIANVLAPSKWLGSGSGLFCSSRREESNSANEFDGGSFNSYSMPASLKKMTPNMRKQLQAGRWGLQDDVVQGLLSSSPALTDEIVRQAIRSNVTTNDALRFFLWAGSQDNYQHCREAYDFMIKQLSAQSKKYGDFYDLNAYMLLKEMRLKGHPPTTSTFLSVIELCARHGRTAEALQVFNQIVNSGCQPSDAMCKALIASSIKAKEWKAALLIFRQLTDAGYLVGTESQSSLLRSLQDEGYDELAVLMLKRKEIGLTLSSKDFVFAVVSFLNLGREEEAWKLVEEIFKRGESNVVAYLKKLIVKLCENGKIQAILKLEDVMKMHGIQYIPHWFFVVIGDLLTAGKTQEAIDFVKNIPNSFVSENLEDFCRVNEKVIQWIVSGKVQMSMLFDFIQWKVSQGYADKIEYFSKDVEKLCKLKKYHEAFELTEFLLSMDPKWVPPCLDILINCLSEDAKAAQLM